MVLQEVTQLRKEVERLRRQLSTSRSAEPAIDLQEVTDVHGIAVPAQLRTVASAIEDSRHLLDLEDDWDGNGTPGYARATWERAAGFLVVLATTLASQSGMTDPDVEILPGSGGSLNLDWKIGNRELLIIVPEDQTKEARFYGDDGKAGQQVKGTLDTSQAHDWLLLWLTE